MTFELIPFPLCLQVMMSEMRRSTNLPTVHKRRTVTVPETQAASSHQNARTAKKTQSSSQTLWILNVLICQTDTLTFRAASRKWFQNLSFNFRKMSKCHVNVPYFDRLATYFPNVEKLDTSAIHVERTYS